MSVFDKTTTFNVVLYILLIFLKICTVSESVHLNISISQVVMPLLSNHTKVSKPETSHCNTQLLWQVKMLDSTSNLIICGQKSVQQFYCKQRLFKAHILFLPLIWLHWQVKMLNSTSDLIIFEQKSVQQFYCNQQLFKDHVVVARNPPVE